MISRVNIYFEDQKLRINLESYCHEHGTSFSKAVLEFMAAGFSLFQKTGSMNIDLLIEKLGRLDEAKREIEFMREVIRNNAEQINKLLGIGIGPSTESAVGMAEPTQGQESVGNADADRPRRQMQLKNNRPKLDRK